MTKGLKWGELENEYLVHIWIGRMIDLVQSANCDVRRRMHQNRILWSLLIDVWFRRAPCSTGFETPKNLIRDLLTSYEC